MSSLDAEFEAAMFSRIHSAVGCVNLLSHKSSASSSAAAAQSPITSSDPQLESLINLDPEPEDSACLMSEKLSNVHDPTVEPDDSPFRSSVPADDTLVCDGSPSAGPETVTDDISPCIIVPVMMSVVGSKTVSATPVVWCRITADDKLVEINIRRYLTVFNRLLDPDHNYTCFARESFAVHVQPVLLFAPQSINQHANVYIESQSSCRTVST